MHGTRALAEKTHKLISLILWNIFIIIILFLILEFFSGLIVGWYYRSEDAINFEAFQNKTLGKEYLKEVNAVEAIYSPYIEYSVKSNISGRFINTDENGLRKTTNPCKSENSVKIFVFGGSTVFGGIGDDNTLPSLISKKLCNKGVNVEVTNFGVSGYENTKEIIKLELELRNGNIPDIVIFYDGVNEIYSAFQNGYAGAPQNLENRKAEFNKKDKVNLKGYILYSDTMTLIRGISKKIFKNKVKEDNNINNAELSKEIVDIYFENIKIVKALEKEYKFKSYFFWQPVIYFDKPLTEGESSAELKNVKPLYLETYQKIPEKEERINFYDIRDVFSDVKEDVYIDFAHLNEKGNEIVAERIVEIIMEKEEF